MGVGLSLIQYEPSPGVTGITTPGGGSWAAATYCFCVFASYHKTGSIASVDYLGVDRSSPAACSNIAVALNDQVVAAFAPGTSGIEASPEYGTKYCLAYQAAATPNWANAWTIVAQSTNPFATSLTATSAASLGTITLNATSTVISIGSVNHMQVSEPNDKVTRGYTDKLIRRTKVNDAYCRAITLNLPGGAMTHAEWSRVGKFASLPTRMRLVETEWSDPTLDAPIQIYEGYIMPTEYLNSLYKNRFQEYPLTMLVEQTTPSAQVP